MADITAERAKALNLKEVRGAEVTNVAEDSPAAKAGIKEGDVVLEYDGDRRAGYRTAHPAGARDSRRPPGEDCRCGATARRKP